MAKGKLTWLGHSFVRWETADGKVILFDPWTKDDGNPTAAVSLADIERADLVLVSHDHFDHIASARAICEKTGALLGGPVQTMKRLADEGMKTDLQANFGMGYLMGGGLKLDWVQVWATPALHASDSSVAIGHIVRAADGTTLYHAGDTSIFGDMALWARLYPIEVACLPIGGIFTMDAFQASHAVARLQPRLVLPIHYRSFPIIAQSPAEFVRLCGEIAPGAKVLTPTEGECLTLEDPPACHPGGWNCAL